MKKQIWGLKSNQFLIKQQHTLLKTKRKKKKKKSELTYVFSCLTKLEKLLCLKYWGSKSLAKSGGFQTMKLPPLWLQDTNELVNGSSTISYVLMRKGAGEFELPCPCDSSITKFYERKFLKLSRAYIYKQSNIDNFYSTKLSCDKKTKDPNNKESECELKVNWKKKMEEKLRAPPIDV